MKISLISILLALLAAAAQGWAADGFTAAETQMVRSVLERQNTLIRLNALAEQRATASVSALAKADTEQQTRLRAQLLAQAAALGMQGVDGLQAPGYFQRAEAQLQSLTGDAFEQRYLLLALQCHAFLERSLNGEIRSGGNPELVRWARQHIDALEAQSREIDHALYDLK